MLWNGDVSIAINRREGKFEHIFVILEIYNKLKSEKLNESSMKNFPPSKHIIEEPKMDESQKFEDKTQKNDYKPSENAVDDQSNFNEFTINEWVYLKFSNIKFSSKN